MEKKQIDRKKDATTYLRTGPVPLLDLAVLEDVQGVRLGQQCLNHVEDVQNKLQDKKINLENEKRALSKNLRVQK